MDSVHIERLLYYRRHSLCGLEFHERSDWRATVPDTHQLFFDTTLCVRILQDHTYIAIWSATTHENKTHVLYDCISHTK